MTAKKAVDAQKSTMAVSVEQIKNSLKYSSFVLGEISVDYTKNVNEYGDKNELKKYLASINMATLLESKLLSTDVIECVFFSSPVNDIYLTRFNSLIDWRQKLGIDDFVKSTDTFQNDATSDEWHLVSIGNVSYLMQVYALNDVNIGIMVRISRYAQAIENTTNQEDVEYIFTDNNGTILATGRYVLLDKREKIELSPEVINDFEGKYQIITMPIKEAEINLSSVRDSSDIYYGIDTTQWIIIIFGLFSVVVVVISVFYLRRFIIDPVKRLVYATNEVEKGNLDHRVEKETSSSEFELLVHSFNSMVSEIESLKILSYEEELEKRKSELKYLQMQIRPHFYLNAINTISSLSLQNKNREIRKFIAALSNYLRYLFADNLALVTVKNEISHAVDYIKLQQIKYPHMIFYMAEVKKGCEEFMLPKFLVQTFVENIFKHAFNGEEMLSVFINTQLLEREGEEYVKITIEDNGEGFDEKYINGEISETENIGINNVKKTLALTYGRDDLLQLSNIESGGARVEVIIPDIRNREGDI